MAVADADLSLAEHANRFALHHDGWEDVARAYASASELVWVIGLALLIAAGVVFKRRRLTAAGLVALLAAGLGLAVAWVIAHLVDRPRPFVAHHSIHAFLSHAADASFPSDHVTATFAIACVLVLRLGARATPLLIAAALLAVSRVVVGVHYPSDVIAGAIIGTAAAVAVAVLTPRARRRWRRWWLHELGGHRVAMAVLRALLRLRPRGDATADGRSRVTIMLWNAWLMGGTVRTTLNIAGYLSERYAVELLNLSGNRGGNRGKPFFAHPPGVAISVIDDAKPQTRIQRMLFARPSLLVHRDDRIYDRSSLYTDLRMLQALWRVRSGVLIATRPGLNLLALAARRRGLAVVGWEHMHLSIYKPAMRAAIGSRYRSLDALVTLTGGDGDEYAAAIGDALHVEAIPNAVPQMPGPPSALSEPVVVAAGRLSSQKGFDRLIPAFARVADELPEWTLRICGEGPDHAALDQQATDLGLEGRVVLAGRRPRMWEEMEAASMLALSSRFEGFPMILVEAMSKGLPIVAFDCPTGPREVVRTGHNGFLVADGDEEGLAYAMLQLARDRELRAKLGAHARGDSERYSLEVIGPRWEALIARVTSGAASPEPAIPLAPREAPKS